jgi:5-methylcytosine-specific restriction endonuclease McrA
MVKYSVALVGYAYPVHCRDHFTCRYCGIDGTQSFATWLSLSWDHLLPKGHPNHDNLDFIVTSCQFCNTAANHYFELAERNHLIFDGKTPDELVEQRRPYVMKTRDSYREFWEKYVKSG